MFDRKNIAAMLWNFLTAKIREVQGIDDFKKSLAKLYVLIFLAVWFTIYYYHNHYNLFIYNVHIFRV